MQSSTNYISKNSTNIIKGIALLFMIVLHFFAHPEWYIPQVGYQFSDVFSKYFLGPLGICVGVFAFLTGYFYVFNKAKNIKYSIIKATDLWLSYLFVFLILCIVSISFGCYEFSVKNFILEAVGIYRPTMIFGWYVDFYIAVILLLPLFYKIIRKSLLLSCVLGIIAPLVFTSVIEIIGKPFLHEYLYDFLHNFFLWFPCITSGLVFGEYDLFHQVFDRIFNNNIKSLIIKIFVWVFLGGFAFFGKYFAPEFTYLIGIELDFIYVPLFIYALVNLIYIIPEYEKCFVAVSVLGKYSLSMWFIHGVFFNNAKEYTQTLLFLPRNPILVLIWGIILCLIPSVIINYSINWTLEKKNILINKISGV